MSTTSVKTDESRASVGSLEQSPDTTNTDNEKQLGIEFGKEELAWGFAQTFGQFTLDPNYIRVSAFDSLKQKVMYRPAGSNIAGNHAGGGGSLGITDAETVQGRNRTIIFYFNF